MRSAPPGGQPKLEAVRVFKFGRNTKRQPDGKSVDGRKRGGDMKEREDSGMERKD